MNLVVLVVDRLHSGFLGCYGNTWVATPHFNRLAAEGFLFDQAFVDQPDVPELCRSWWSGTHRLERETADGKLPAQLLLAERFAGAGFVTTCMTDEPLVADHPLAGRFEEVLRLGPAANAEHTAPGDSIEETHLARFFASAVEWLDGAREPFFLWLHSQGMSAPWDAPDEFRLQYADADEMPPPCITQPPSRDLASHDDPDELWGICQSYAGQVTLLDECLGGWLESLEAEQLLADTLLVVLGARGFPLGRNGHLGDVEQALFGELVQTPWLMRFPDRLNAAGRSASLVQPSDLAPTLLEIGGLAVAAGGSGRSLMPLVREELFALRDRICLVGRDGERGFRTPAWYLRTPAGRTPGDQPLAKLYAKPDDRWEQNDVADRCPDVVAALAAAQNELAAGLAAGTWPERSPLDDSLVNDLR
ncbi:MAG TPA: sulfatase-like hydrolase/transferase [Pirellulales bacterium]|nr:sulfatase-like hydrolase/transferase [Pirellulales bacterium]